jgi:hypothetical protein
MYHRYNSPKYTKEEIKAYLEDNTKPDFTFMMSYNSRYREYTMLTSFDSHFGIFRDPNESYVEFFKKAGFYFKNDPHVAQETDVSTIHFSFKADAARELAKLLESYQFKCPAPFNVSANTNGVANAFHEMKIANSQQGGRLFKKKSSKKRNNKRDVVKSIKKYTRRSH